METRQTRNTYLYQNAEAIALLLMENRHKAEKTYFHQNAKAITLLFHLKLR